MASIVIADTWADELLTIVLNGDSGPANFVYHLFDNDFTPVPSSGYGDFSETSADGYGPETVPRSGWSASGTPTGTTTATHADLTWTLTEAATLYGYFVSVAGGVLGWSQRFDSPIAFGAGGGSITLTPTLVLVTPIP